MNSFPLIYMSVIRPVPQCLDYCCFIVSFKNEKYRFSNLILSLQDCFGFPGFLVFHRKLGSACWPLQGGKEKAWIWMEIVLNLFINLGNIATIKMSNISFQENGMSFHLFLNLLKQYFIDSSVHIFLFFCKICSLASHFLSTYFLSV